MQFRLTTIAAAYTLRQKEVLEALGFQFRLLPGSALWQRRNGDQDEDGGEPAELPWPTIDLATPEAFLALRDQVGYPLILSMEAVPTLHIYDGYRE